MQIARLRVSSLDIDHRAVTWEVDETDGKPYLDYELEVQRSESSEGPFTSVSPRFRNRYRFVDNNPPVGHRYRTLYYRLVYKHLPSGVEGSSPALAQEPLPDLNTVEMRRHTQVLLRNISGRRCWLLPVRTFGRRCPACWNAVQGQRTKSKCLSCYDTGFLGGYLHPIEVFVDIDPSTNNNQPTQMMNLQENVTTARTSFTPGMKPGDLLIEGENRRWDIASVTTTEHLRATVMQMLKLTEVYPQDIEMRVPLDIGEAIEDVWLSPKGGYTNAHDIEHANPDLATHLRLFYGI